MGYGRITVNMEISIYRSSPDPVQNFRLMGVARDYGSRIDLSIYNSDRVQRHVRQHLGHLFDGGQGDLRRSADR